ncbi:TRANSCRIPTION TERMINATION FACTOR 2 [Salix purpurea]|uniref:TRANSCRIPTION TERMINATION FACTOR 2 n=1 Tax=Salix purpurea TaxID=77065 RepID=A0A9Q0VXA1_SALPP|nr:TRANSCRIPTION TERMINATION FACTOR 2 [Salix purpurea]
MYSAENQKQLPDLSRSLFLYLTCSQLFLNNFEEPGRFPAIIPSKVSTLIKPLKESRDVRSTSKSVVLTLFQKTLVQLQEPLKDAGFNVLQLDALSDSRRRDGIIKRFRSAGQDTVLLANVKVSGAGINLTAASEVYLLEPWWNSAFEERAIDRVLQYGQEKNVRIIRLIAEDSIEERILAMQERKKQVIEASGRHRGQKGYWRGARLARKTSVVLLSLNNIPTYVHACIWSSLILSSQGGRRRPSSMVLRVCLGSIKSF